MHGRHCSLQLLVLSVGAKWRGNLPDWQPLAVLRQCLGRVCDALEIIEPELQPLQGLGYI
jgi:hypothetical protein